MAEKGKSKATSKPKSNAKPKVTAKPRASAKPKASAAKLGFSQTIKQFGIWCAKTAAKLTLALLLGMVIYLIYLDNKVTRKFEGKKWQIPAQIFAKSVSFSRGSKISMAQLVEHLEQLNYHQTNKLTGAGQYLVSRDHVSVIRRAHELPSGYQNELGLIIEFKGEQVHRVVNRDNQSPITTAHFEPLLIERLLSPHQQDREFLPLESFPEAFKDTLLLVEDRDFYHHSGVSVTAILRALWTNLMAGRTVQGGSTLTQQLAKNFYLNHERSLVRKINEAFIALLLDYRYSKDQILEAYVNEVFLGQFHNRAIHGFGLASFYYFAKPINELSPQEFAVLVGTIKGPSYYNPHRQVERVLKRRDLVLRLMFKHHVIDKPEYELAVNSPLGVSDKKAFMPLRFPAYIGQVKRDLRRFVQDKDILSDGIKVFTYLDPRIQKASEWAIVHQLPKIEAEHNITNVQAASVSVDIKTGGINAMVGAKEVNYSGLNRAVDMHRNIGSLIKPAVYLQALDKPDDYHLGTLLADEPITLRNRHGKKWSPQNFSKDHLGQMALIDALAQSQNVPTVNLGMSLGVGEVSDGLRKLGVSGNIPQYPSMFLGALELSPLEVSQMYTTIAARGIYKPLSSIESVIGSEGEVIWQNQLSARASFSPQSIYLLNQALQEVTKTGTAKQLSQQFAGVRFAGKTGTTDDLRDSWFSGFDNDTVSTFWLGKDDYSPVDLTATQGALRLFRHMRTQVPGNSINDSVPAQIEQRYFSNASGKEVAKGCKNVRKLAMNTQGKEAAKLCIE